MTTGRLPGMSSSSSGCTIQGVMVRAVTVVVVPAVSSSRRDHPGTSTWGVEPALGSPSSLSVGGGAPDGRGGSTEYRPPKRGTLPLSAVGTTTSISPSAPLVADAGTVRTTVRVYSTRLLV